MKKKYLATLVFALFCATNMFAQEAEEFVVGPAIKFKKADHNFGDITQGDQVSHVFEFSNIGTEPLVLSNVRSTCGCTIPKWPKDPVLPGESSSILVNFNSRGKMGVVKKVVTVYSNAYNGEAKVDFTTNVLPAVADASTDEE